MGTRFPAVKLDSGVYVATRGLNDPQTNRRMPVRHTDALTYAIRIIAASKTNNWTAAKLIKAIDMNQISVIFGSALADGSDFQTLIENN